MPRSFNGIGTSLVRISKKRQVEGHVQFDAVEAFVVLLCPLVPYKTVHVLSWRHVDPEQERYYALTLRPSARLIAKGFLNGWGSNLMYFAGAMAPILSVVFAMMERPVNATDVTILIVLWSLFAIGVAAKLLFVSLNRADERIKDIIGPHDLGTSDPYYWPDEMIDEAIASNRDSHEQQPLLTIAEDSLRQGDRARAMFLTRLGMRSDEPTPFLELFDRLKQVQPDQSLPPT